jgi:hypothetical protein
MRRGRAGGWIGLVVIGGYLLLRIGFLVFREREEGVSTIGIVETVIGFLLFFFLVTQIVQWVQRARAGSRDRQLATMHPTAYLVPVSLKRDLVDEIKRAQSMLGLPANPIPRSGTATLVADGNGLGLYAGGAEPQLVVGFGRGVVAHVGQGRTSAGGRYGIGSIEALQVFLSTGQHWTTVDLPVYKRVVGYPRTISGEELDAVVHRVATAAGVSLAPVQAR